MARSALVDCAYLLSLPAREEERLDLDAHFLWVILPVNTATLGSSRDPESAFGTAN